VRLCLLLEMEGRVRISKTGAGSEVGGYSGVERGVAIWAGLGWSQVLGLLRQLLKTTTVRRRGD
jgi:hypothetical protein